MDLNPIGAHCTLSSCHELDLLPILCPHCAHQYCRAHFTPDSHACATASQSRPLTTADKLERCAVDNCHKTALSMTTAVASASTVSPTCAQCSGFYCAEHRHPDSHRCSGLATKASAPATSKQDAAKALLAKNFTSASKPPAKSTTKTKKLPTDPVKLAQYRKVEAMKMRHKAKPGDPRDTSAPLEKRLHMYVRAADQTETKTLWVRKTMSTGRALDCFATLFSLSSGHFTCSRQQPHQLTLEGEEPTILHNDLPIGEQVQDASTLLISPRS
ncbi:hypothetical protein EV122DRAFT_219490 [Schizophyllum commune]